VKNKSLTARQLQRNRLITRFRYVVERTFGSQVRWLGGKTLRYQGRAKAHAWHILLVMAYNLKRLSKLFVQSSIRQEKYALLDKNRVENPRKQGEFLLNHAVRRRL